MTDALATIPASAQALLASLRTHATQIGAIVDVCPLDTPEADAKARQLLQLIQTLDAQAEAERVALKAPHLKRGQEIDAAFKGPRKDLERVGGILRRRLAEAAVQREAARTAALAAAAEATRAGNVQAANEAIQVAAAAPPTVAGVSDRLTWEATGFDLAKMPAAFLTVDMVRIREHIREADRTGRQPEIPGVTFERTAAFRVSKL